ncbi:hypothetical protein SRHO_G00079620 [Serrasalmus rhombeus]
MLNDNLELQGKDKTVINTISSINAFERKKQHLSSKLQGQLSELETQGKSCVQLDICLSEFDKRFQDFALIEPIATFMCYPFREDAEVVSLASKIATLFQLNSSGVEDEILTLQANIELKSRAHGQFWNLLTEEKYPNMRKCATSLTALFGSTYLCESAFSHMKIIKSKYCSTMTDDHLEVCLRLAISNYCPDYASLIDCIQCKSSEESRLMTKNLQSCAVQYGFMQLFKLSRKKRTDNQMQENHDGSSDGSTSSDPETCEFALEFALVWRMINLLMQHQHIQWQTQMNLQV